MNKVLIGIQARSNSVRFPGKCSLPFFDNVTITGQVLNQALRARPWLRNIADIHVAVLIPYDDPIGKHFPSYVFEGDEHDVLSRYALANDKFKADYVVRLTGDCCWMTSHIIAKCLRAAISTNSDYVSNVLVRSFMEGMDCEVLSASLLEYLDARLTSDVDREHVTIGFLNMLKQGNAPKDFKIHTIMSEYDLSHLKTSIDTQEEHIQAISKIRDLRSKTDEARQYGGVTN